MNAPEMLCANNKACRLKIDMSVAPLSACLKVTATSFFPNMFIL